MTRIVLRRVVLFLAAVLLLLPSAASAQNRSASTGEWSALSAVATGSHTAYPTPSRPRRAGMAPSRIVPNLPTVVPAGTSIVISLAPTISRTAAKKSTRMVTSTI